MVDSMMLLLIDGVGYFPLGIPHLFTFAIICIMCIDYKTL